MSDSSSPRDANKISLRLGQFSRRLWTKSELENWYQIDFADIPTQRLLAETGWFAGTFDKPTTLKDGADHFNHWHWERFLQRRELVPVIDAAAQLAMSVADFRRVTEQFMKHPGVSSVGSPWANDSNCVVRKAFLRDFHKGFESLRRTIFASHSSYIRQIHHEISEQLGIRFETRFDCTDSILGETEPRSGYYVDCLTDEPVGLGREVFLEFKKPIELAPDCCSWLTFANHKNLILPYMLGNRPGLTQEIIDQLRSAQ